MKLAVYNFNLPSAIVRINDTVEIICKTAIEQNLDCVKYCYALKAEQRWKNVREKYAKNFLATKDEDFVFRMNKEISFLWETHFRIHSSGEFYSEEYFNKWVTICKSNPKTTFWTYTKEVELGKVKRPSNFILIYSCSEMNNLNVKKPEGFDNIAYISDEKNAKFNCPNQTKSKNIKCAKQCFKCLRKSDVPIIFKKH